MTKFIGVPKPIPFSPVAILAENLLPDDLVIRVSNIGFFPVLDANEYTYVTLSNDHRFSKNDPAEYETIKIDGATPTSGNEGELLIGGRNVEVGGSIKDPWSEGTFIVCTINSKVMEDFYIAKLNAMGGTFQALSEGFVDPTVGGDVSIDISQSNFFKHTMNNNCNVIFVEPPEDNLLYTFHFLVKMHTSARDLNFPASVRWASGTTPLTPSGSLMALYSFFTINKGVRWYGCQVFNNVQE